MPILDYLYLLSAESPIKPDPEALARLRAAAKGLKVKAHIEVPSLANRSCDRCRRPYSEHAVDEDGVYDICGWYVKPKEPLKEVSDAGDR